MISPSTAMRSPFAFLLALVLAAGLALGAQDARDAWQRPADVLDALEIREGSVVADIGCGSGYFTRHLARRVGPGGLVYAVDIDPESLDAVHRWAEQEKISHVRIVRSEPDDPRLPAAVIDVALIVDTYHEFTHPDQMLEKIYAALKPGGRLGIIDRELEAGDSRASYRRRRRHRIPRELVQEDAARHGFRFVREAPGFVRPRGNLVIYFLILQKPTETN
jgi:predicted methyltransferase